MNKYVKKVREVRVIHMREIPPPSITHSLMSPCFNLRPTYLVITIHEHSTQFLAVLNAFTSIAVSGGGCITVNIAMPYL